MSAEKPLPDDRPNCCGDPIYECCSEGPLPDDQAFPSLLNAPSFGEEPCPDYEPLVRGGQGRTAERVERDGSWLDAALYILTGLAVGFAAGWVGA